MRRNRSREQWAELIAEFKRSGESRDAFATRHGIPPKTLSWWMWCHERRNGNQKNGSRGRRRKQPTIRMLPVTIRSKEEMRKEMVEIVLSGATMRFPAETSAKYVGDLLVELKTIAC